MEKGYGSRSLLTSFFTPGSAAAAQEQYLWNLGTTGESIPENRTELPAALYRILPLGDYYGKEKTVTLQNLSMPTPIEYNPKTVLIDTLVQKHYLKPIKETQWPTVEANKDNSRIPAKEVKQTFEHLYALGLCHLFYRKAVKQISQKHYITGQWFEMFLLDSTNNTDVYIRNFGAGGVPPNLQIYQRHLHYAQKRNYI